MGGAVISAFLIIYCSVEIARLVVGMDTTGQWDPGPSTHRKYQPARRDGFHHAPVDPRPMLVLNPCSSVLFSNTVNNFVHELDDAVCRLTNPRHRHHRGKLRLF